MHIEINDKTPLSEIQQVFSDFYPYLKIEFCSKRHKKHKNPSEKNLIDPGILIGDINHTHASGFLEIWPLYKIADVVREFQDRFGLTVEIFRKEKNGWEQSTGTDDFTLKEINEIGRSSSDEYIIEDYEKGLE